MATEKRLIDANALKEYLNSIEASGGHKYYRKGMDDVLHFHMPNIIDDAPTVDAVEVVRCKDCKHFDMREMECQNEYVAIDNEGGADFSLGFYLDDFCSYGERKDK